MAGRSSRSRSRERRRDRSRSRSRERRRGGSRERTRDSRRRSPDRRERDRPRGPDRSRSPRREQQRGERPAARGHSAKRWEEQRRGRSRSPRREQRERERSLEREQRPLPAPEPERRGPGPCFKCGEEGHLARDCPNAPAGGGRGPCYKCGEEGHIARDCPNPEAAGAGPGRRRRGGDGGEEADMAWGKPGEQEEEEAPPDKEVEPDFGLSGALAAETNKVNGVVLLHQEPAEARKPTARWRLYVFKNGQIIGDPLHIHRLSSYLFGRERRVADIPTDHPSCSKQHAVLQYRLTEKEGADGMMKAAVRPYVMDLGSTNGTFLNGERLEAERYYELLAEDVLKFGNSSREYIILKEA